MVEGRENSSDEEGDSDIGEVGQHLYPLDSQ